MRGDDDVERALDGPLDPRQHRRAHLEQRHGLAGHEHRALEQQLGRGRHDAQAAAVGAAGVDERDELGRRQLEAGHDDVVGAVLGDDLLEVGERAEARRVEQRERRRRAR